MQPLSLRSGRATTGTRSTGSRKRRGSSVVEPGHDDRPSASDSGGGTPGGYIIDPAAPYARQTSTARFPRQSSISRNTPSQSRGYHLSQSEQLPLSSGYNALVQTDSFQYFEPHRDYYPNMQFLPNLVALFFVRARNIFGFLDMNAIRANTPVGALSPMLANCIAAFSARFLERLGARSEERNLWGEPYLEAAEVRVYSIQFFHCHFRLLAFAVFISIPYLVCRTLTVYMLIFPCPF